MINNYFYIPFRTNSGISSGFPQPANCQTAASVKPRQSREYQSGQGKYCIPRIFHSRIIFILVFKQIVILSRSGPLFVILRLAGAVIGNSIGDATTPDMPAYRCTCLIVQDSSEKCTVRDIKPSFHKRKRFQASLICLMQYSSQLAPRQKPQQSKQLTGRVIQKIYLPTTFLCGSGTSDKKKVSRYSR